MAALSRQIPATKNMPMTPRSARSNAITKGAEYMHLYRRILSPVFISRTTQSKKSLWFRCSCPIAQAASGKNWNPASTHFPIHWNFHVPSGKHTGHMFLYSGKLPTSVQTPSACCSPTACGMRSASQCRASFGRMGRLRNPDSSSMQTERSSPPLQGRPRSIQATTAMPSASIRHHWQDHIVI